MFPERRNLQLPGTAQGIAGSRPHLSNLVGHRSTSTHVRRVRDRDVPEAEWDVCDLPDRHQETESTPGTRSIWREATVLLRDSKRRGIRKRDEAAAGLRAGECGDRRIRRSCVSNVVLLSKALHAG